MLGWRELGPGERPGMAGAELGAQGRRGHPCRARWGWLGEERSSVGLVHRKNGGGDAAAQGGR